MAKTYDYGGRGTVNITITNLPQIKAAFAASPRIMSKNLNFAIKRSIFYLKGLSQRFTPVDTGLLRGSHYTEFMNLRGEVGTNTEYDIFVHEGTRFMTARPYMRHAAEAGEGFVDAEFLLSVEKTLDEIGKKT